MKKLEELGISPTPWGYSLGNRQMLVTRGTAQTIFIEYGLELQHAKRPMRYANARMFAAAPELYQALWFQCFGNTGVGNCRNCKGAELGNCKTCPLGNARAALAKASGEGEVAP